MAAKSNEKIHSRSKDNIDIEFFSTPEGYMFIVYVFDKKRVKVLDNSPSKPYKKLGIVYSVELSSSTT